MDEIQTCRSLRKSFSKPAFAALGYCILMNVVVTVVAIVEIIVMLADGTTLRSALEQASQSGLGYLLASVIGAAALLLRTKKQYFFRDIWRRTESMTLSGFFMILCVFVSCQALFQIISWAMEWILNLLDLSILKSMQIASLSADSLSMFLYLALAAPVFEEILFRGLILRSLEPYGRRFAIFASAFLFGIYHSNLVQTPYAFAVGLILGYVTVEYSMVWAVTLHMINNLVLGEVLPRLLNLLPNWVGELTWSVIIWGGAVGALIILMLNRHKIAEYLRDGKMQTMHIKSFFTSPGVLVMSAVMAVSMIAMLFL